MSADAHPLVSPRPGIAGKIALVTGAAQGIGAAVASVLAAHGARIAAVDRNEAVLDVTVKELRAVGADAVAHVADVRDRHEVDATVERVERESGPIGILVNVAGVLRTGPVVDLTDDDWETVLAVNAGGVFRFSRSVARRMVARRSGAIVTVASNAAKVPRVHMAAYAASKAATVAFTKCLGLELAPVGIRCNLVSPGSTDTDMQRGLWTSEHDAQAVIEGSLDAYRVGIPLRKIARPADVADAVAFLASDDAKHITLHDLYVDGGAALGA